MTVGDTLSFLRERPVPDVTKTVMERIRVLETEATVAPASTRWTESSPVAWLGNALDWIWAPRSLQIRPAWALAGLAVAAMGIGLLPLQTNEVAGPGTDMFSATAPSAPVGHEATAIDRSAEAQEPVLYVRFELDAAGASSVSLAGSFTEWEPSLQLAETRPGHWAALVPLEPGVHDYAFVVDGERWVADPDAMRVNDGFGGINSRVALLAPENIQTRTERSS